MDLRGPFRWSLVQLAAGALAVPAAHGVGVKTSCGLAAEFRRGGKHVGVDCCHHLLLNHIDQFLE